MSLNMLCLKYAFLNKLEIDNYDLKILKLISYHYITIVSYNKDKENSKNELYNIFENNFDNLNFYITLYLQINDDFNITLLYDELFRNKQERFKVFKKLIKNKNININKEHYWNLINQIIIYEKLNKIDLIKFILFNRKDYKIKTFHCALITDFNIIELKIIFSIFNKLNIDLNTLLIFSNFQTYSLKNFINSDLNPDLNLKFFNEMNEKFEFIKIEFNNINNY